MTPEVENQCRLLEAEGLLSFRTAQRALPELLSGKLETGCRDGHRWGIVAVNDEVKKNLDMYVHPPVEVGPRIRILTIELRELA